MVAARGGKWVSPDILEGGQIWIPDGARLDTELPLRFETWCFENLRFPAGYGEGEPVAWEDWQRTRIVYPLLGLVWDDPPEYVAEGSRVVRQCFYLSARGTGKTSFGAALGLWCLADGWDSQPDVDLFAVSREQADRLYKEAARFVQNSDTLRDRYDIMSDRKVIHPAGVRTYGLNTRSGDSKAELGLRPTLAIVDELLSQRNRSLWDAIRTGTGKRPNSLLVTFTTPDVAVESFAKKEYERAKMIQNNRAAAPDYLPVIFEPDPDDDIFDRRTWVKAAPSLESGFLDWAAYESEAQEARLDKTAEHAFRIYRCAMWADAGHGYIDMTLWDANRLEMPDRSDLATMPNFFGLDMALNEDLASLAMLFKDDERGCLWVMWRHWMTDGTYRKVNNFTHGQFSEWVADDTVDIREFGGNWIDGQSVADQVAELALEFQPISIGVDNFRSREIHKLLGEDGYGLNVNLLSQTGRAMQAATERLSAEVHARRLFHNGDQVARWAASNCEVKYDQSGFPKVRKRGGEVTSPVKIDPIDALAMAVDRMNAWEKDGDTREMPAKVWRTAQMRRKHEADDKERVLVNAIPDWN